MVKSQSDFLMKNLQAISRLSTEGAPEKANFSQPLTRNCLNVRERIMKIRIIEKMKETELKEYSDKLGIKDVSYMRDTKIGDPGIRKVR